MEKIVGFVYLIIIIKKIAIVDVSKSTPKTSMIVGESHLLSDIKIL